MIIHDDCVEWLSNFQGGMAKCIFADPPDNIKLHYDGYNDDKIESDYYNWMELMIMKALEKCEVFWISYNLDHDLELKRRIYGILKSYRSSWKLKQFIWRFTFGEYNNSDCGIGMRPLLRFMKPGCQLYPDRIRVESKRMEEFDPRAAGPRVPDNVWEFPRVVGNAKERRSWHPTQHPEALMERIIKLSCGENELFVDLFTGSGTSGIVCKRLGVPFKGIEISEIYCGKLREMGL